MSNKKGKKSGVDHSTYVPQRDKIDFDLKIQLKFELTEKQKSFINLIEDKKTKIVLCKGAAGTAKTFLAVYSALLAMKEKRIGQIHYLRNPVESSSYNLGFLPGTADEKIKPYLMPLMDKMHELLVADDIKRLEKENRVTGNTLGFVRGASYNASYIIVDEAQNLSVQDFLLIMTRLGKFSKLIILGDYRQSDVKNSGFEKIYNLFNNDIASAKGINTFKFSKEDIMREPLIGFILDEFEKII